MHRTRVATLLTALFVLGLAAFGALAADAARTSGFTAVVNPLSQLPGGGRPWATSCPSTHFCVAVGEVDAWQPLVIAGDPVTWNMAQAKAIELGPKLGYGGTLYSVSCTSSTSCVAVGYDGHIQPIVLAGNPATWGAAQVREITLGAAFNGFNYLFSVTCTSSSSCVAGGEDGNAQPIVLVGNPATWGAAQVKEITLGAAFGPAFGANGNAFSSLSCISPTSCVAAGGDANGQPFTLIGNPYTWGAAQAREITFGAAFGGHGYLGSVTCTSSASCVEVGADGNQKLLVLAGDPSTWGEGQAQEIDVAGGLSSLACPSPRSCVAVGGSAGDLLLLAGDPSTWGSTQVRTIQLGQAFGSEASLTDVACTSSATCLAVGQDYNRQPFQLTGDPSTWDAAQARELKLSGVASGTQADPFLLTCVSATSCFDLGGYYTTHVNGSYLLHGSPTTWNAAGGKLLTYGLGAADTFDAMTCTSSTYCVAVGSSHVGSSQLLVATGNPSTWNGVQAGTPTTTQDIPQVRKIPLGTAFGGIPFLHSIACTSPTYCVVVGNDGTYSKGQPFVLAGNPSTWTFANAREITLGKGRGSAGSLDSVSCVSRTQCVAVGHDGYQGNAVQPLVFTGNPATWSAAQAKEITLAKYGTLSSVACPSSTYCVSVGQSGANGKPLVLAGDPHKWNMHSPFQLRVPPATATSVTGFSPVYTYPGDLSSVGCRSSMYCVAVGGDMHGAPLYITGNPAYWKGRFLTRPIRSGAFTTAYLASSSCTRLACFAGGLANGGDFVATVR